MTGFDIVVIVLVLFAIIAIFSAVKTVPRVQKKSGRIMVARASRTAWSGSLRFSVRDRGD